jgi:sugar lactone lactonase YvrE
VGPAGSQRRLNSAVTRPMKMVIGPGGALYVSGQQGTVYRIDPATGGVITAASTSFRLGGLSFTTDYKSLIVAGGNQGLHALDLRGDGTLAPPRSWRSEVRNAEALAADACGNLYAIVENDSRVWRVSAAGKVDVLADLRGVYAWSLAFGSGQQGWSAISLYVMEATGPMYEVSVAVPGQAPPLAASD